MRFCYLMIQTPLGQKEFSPSFDAKYTKTDLTQVVKTCSDLTASEQIELLTLLQKFEQLSYHGASMNT